MPAFARDGRLFVVWNLLGILDLIVAVADGAILRKKVAPLLGEANESAASFFVPPVDKATFVRVLPHGQPRARSAPSLHHLCVWLRIGSDPFQEIEDQWLERIRQGSLHSVLVNDQCDLNSTAGDSLLPQLVAFWPLDLE